MRSTNVAPAEDMDADAHLEGWDVLYNMIIFFFLANILLHNRNLFVYVRAWA